MSKRLRATEPSQRELIRLIENISQKVDSLLNAISQQGC